MVLKQKSEQEVAQLWSQLESMRASRQELGGDSDVLTLTMNICSVLRFQLSWSLILSFFCVCH